MTQLLKVNGALSRSSKVRSSPRFHLVAEQRGIPLQLADDLLGVRVEQQLVGIEAVAGRRFVGAVDAEAIDRARPRIRQIAVPDFVGVFRQHDTFGLALARGVEQAEFDFGALRREQREIDAEAVPGRAERVGQTFREVANGAGTR